MLLRSLPGVSSWGHTLPLRSGWSNQRNARDAVDDCCHKACLFHPRCPSYMPACPHFCDGLKYTAQQRLNEHGSL